MISHTKRLKSERILSPVPTLPYDISYTYWIWYMTSLKCVKTLFQASQPIKHCIILRIFVLHLSKSLSHLEQELLSQNPHNYDDCKSAMNNIIRGRIQLTARGSLRIPHLSTQKNWLPARLSKAFPITPPTESTRYINVPINPPSTKQSKLSNLLLLGWVDCRLQFQKKKNSTKLHQQLPPLLQATKNRLHVSPALRKRELKGTTRGIYLHLQERVRCKWKKSIAVVNNQTHLVLKGVIDTPILLQEIATFNPTVPTKAKTSNTTNAVCVNSKNKNIVNIMSTIVVTYLNANSTMLLTFAPQAHQCPPVSLESICQSVSKSIWCTHCWEGPMQQYNHYSPFCPRFFWLCVARNVKWFNKNLWIYTEDRDLILRKITRQLEHAGCHLRHRASCSIFDQLSQP